MKRVSKADVASVSLLLQRLFSDLSFKVNLLFFPPYSNRFNKQYSKEFKAKEVSEGEESKDFWNVLGGKTGFVSLLEGL